jgi:hypothetical protein
MKSAKSATRPINADLHLSAGMGAKMSPNRTDKIGKMREIKEKMSTLIHKIDTKQKENVEPLEPNRILG